MTKVKDFAICRSSASSASSAVKTLFAFAVSFFTISVLLCMALPCSGFESIRVAIADNQRTVSIKAAGLRIEGRSGDRLDRTVTFTAATLGSSPVRASSSQGLVKVNGHSYRGTIEIRKKATGTLLVINDLDLESYLLGVVAAEIPADWEMEVLKAQAVSSRTYALYQKMNAGRRPYHILATVDSQVYLGKRGERQRAAQAVTETRGMIITFHGEVIPAFYHASCGGHTEERPCAMGHR